MKDDFDRVINEWGQERPDLDVWPIEIMARLQVLGRRTARFYQESVRELGLRASDFFVLSELRRAGKPYSLAPGELCRVLVRSSGGMTKQIDHLERAGWVCREPDPIDRRALKIRLTSSGLKLIDRALTKHIANEQHLLRKLPAQERRQVIATLKRLLAHID